MPSSQIVVTLLILALAGCGTLSEDPPPAPDIPARWSEAPRSEASATLSPSPWWNSFNDPELNTLVERAIRANTDVQLAEARVREARARANVATASLRPSATVKASAVRERESANAPVPVVIAPDGKLETESGQTENLFQAGFDANWELDLFGGGRAAAAAASADLGSSVYERDAAVVTLLGEVARTYIELRGVQEQIAITRKTLANVQDMLTLIRARYVGGFATDIDIARAEAQVESTSSQIPPLDAARREAVHRLSVLLGAAPGTLAAELEETRPIPVPAVDPPVGLPSDVLRQRPDIRSAERQVAAARARLKSAKADLYPKFSILGSVGLASISAGNFFNPASTLWSIGPSISWPIFDGGRIVGNIEVHDAQEQQALISYRKAILTGLEEVENAIVAYGHERDREAMLAKALSAQKRAADSARSLYTSGHTDFRDVLTAEQNLAQAQSDLARSETAVGVGAVALYKSLGGGWDTEISRSPRDDGATAVPVSVKEPAP